MQHGVSFVSGSERRKEMLVTLRTNLKLKRNNIKIVFQTDMSSPLSKVLLPPSL